MRSSFLKITNASNELYIHVSIIGSKEDGLLNFLYCIADDIEVRTNNNAPDIMKLDDVLSATPLCTIQKASIYSKPDKEGIDEKKLEDNIIIFDITVT